MSDQEQNYQHMNHDENIHGIEGEQEYENKRVYDVNENNDNDENMEDNQEEMKRPNDEEKEEEERKRRRAKEEQKQHDLEQKQRERVKEYQHAELKQKREDSIRHELRDRIHPRIIEKAHPVKNNVVLLIKLFYPQSNLSHNASPKEILKVFKKALASFHPDKTIHKSLEEQIEAEEIFKLLSTEKQKFENGLEAQSNCNRSSSHQHHRSYHRYSNHRPARHGWF